MTDHPTIYLRELVEKDTANIVRWRNDPAVRKNLFSQAPITEEQHLLYFRKTVQAGLCSQYVISVTENSRTFDIGTAFIKRIDCENRKGEFGMFIGEQSSRGKGYALPVVRQMLSIAFLKLKLHRVYLSVMADNIPAIKVYERAGFTKEGILKDDYLRSDGFVDIIVMGITEPYWQKTRE